MHKPLSILNPKRSPSSTGGRDEWFRYYAGFSPDFARQIVRSSGLQLDAVFMDPWNGSGTTTSAASLYGYRSLGFDLNPAMAVAAKARVLPRTEAPSIEPLLSAIKSKAEKRTGRFEEGDPLLTWFFPKAAAGIRSIDRAIHTLLVSQCPHESTANVVSRLSSIAAFYYVALFRTVRSLLSKFSASNPTWITRPTNPRSRVRPECAAITALFAQQVQEMSLDILREPREWDITDSRCSISVASSESLPVTDKSVDFVLCSPPYCTRIDYGVATSPELATLGFPLREQLQELRNTLIGTPTIPKSLAATDANWGPTCNAFLARLHDHPSKAAQSYYHKTFVQYFSGIFRSLAELSRCMKSGGRCVIVVQDSYFKDLRVDLASVFVEMAVGLHFALSRQVDFPTLRTFGRINTRSRKYRKEATATESILCFRRK